MTEPTDDPVWLRAAAEVAAAGVDPVVIYQPWTREAWDGLTDRQRSDELQDLAASALEQIASSAASVIDASEVPYAERHSGPDPITRAELPDR